MKVAIITPTIGTKHLEQNLLSVKYQTYKNLKHVVVCDGDEYYFKVKYPTKECDHDNLIVMNLPENTGANGYNGHRIYGAIPFLIDADYFIFLDEDNWIEPNHVESLVNTVQGNDWAFSLRKIVNQEGEYVCNDDCESLGRWHTCLSQNEFFVDVGCYFLPKKIAIQIAPIWYRRARHPEEQPEVDRLLMRVLKQNNTTYETTGEYTLNYRVGNRTDSVQSEFFLRGNEIMTKIHNGVFPWRKENLGSKVVKEEVVGPGISIVS
jgi:glycosyltransferase involved in cell wall biosynthesis